MEDRAPSPGSGRSPPSSLVDPLDCLSPRPAARPRLAPSPTATSSAPPTPSASRSIGANGRGESPLKRPRLSLVEPVQPVEAEAMAREEDRGGELGRASVDDGSDDSDVVPTSDSEERELLTVATPFHVASDGWEEAQTRERAWTARLRAQAHLASSPTTSSFASSKSHLPTSPQLAASVPTTPPSRSSAAFPHAVPTASSFRSVTPRYDPSSSAGHLRSEQAVAGPSRLGYQPHLSSGDTSPRRQLSSSRSPLALRRQTSPSAFVRPPIRRPASQGKSAEVMDVARTSPSRWSDDDEQLAAVGEPARMASHDNGARSTLNLDPQGLFDVPTDVSDGELDLPYFTSPLQRSQSPTSPAPSRSRSTTPRARDSTLPLAGTSSLNPDLDDPDLFPSLSQPHRHSQPHPLPDSPTSSLKLNRDRGVALDVLMQDLAPHSSILTPALSSHSSPPPSPPARSPTITHSVSESQHDASAELPDDATAEEQLAMDDAAQGAFMPQRVFRNRKAIQVNPYQGERALYEAAMRRGNQKDAVVRRREELDIVRRANGGGAVEADSSLQGWLVDEDVSQEDVRRRKGKGRAVEDDDDSGSDGQVEHKELPKDVIERAFRDAGGLLSDDDSEGDEISKEREAAGLMGPPRKRRLSKGKEKETTVKQVRVKKGKKFPMGLLVGQGVEADQGGEDDGSGRSRHVRPGKSYTRRAPTSPRRPFADDRSPSPPPGPVDRPVRIAFDDYPPDQIDNGTSPSPPPARRLSPSAAESPPPASRPGRQLSRRPSAGFGSDSRPSESDGSSTSDDEIQIDPKRLKLLLKTMPLHMAKKILREAAEKQRAARRDARVAVRPAGPIKAGQSVVRRAAPGAVPAKRIPSSPPDGDSDMDASDPEEAEDPAFYHRADQRRERGASVDQLARAVNARYGVAVSEDDESDDSEAVEQEESDDDDVGEVGIKKWLVRRSPAVPRAPSGREGQAFPSPERAMSVVDSMLSRTKAKGRSRLAQSAPRRPTARGTTGAGGSRLRQTRLPSVGSSSRSHGSDGGRRESPYNPPADGVVHLGRHQPAKSRSRPNQAPRHRERHSGPSKSHKARRLPPIVLDDDSIFGGDADLHPIAQDEVENVRRPAKPFLPPRARSKAKGVALAGPLRPRQVNELVRPPPRPPALNGGPPASSPAQPSDGLVVPARSPTIDGVPWTSYAKFTVDFDLHPIQVGVSFPANSAIAKGRLLELVSLVKAEGDDLPRPAPERCSVFELELTPDMSRAEFIPAFELVTDRLFETLEKARALPDSGAGDDENLAEGEGDAREAMRFACLFVSSLVADEDLVDVFKPAVQDQVDHLCGRMESFVPPTSSKRAPETRIYFALHWFAVELSARLDMLETIAPNVEATTGYVVMLMRRLVDRGLNRTVKSIKRAQRTRKDLPPTLQINDVTAEMWVNLIHLTSALDVRQATSGSPSIWTLVEEALRESEPAANKLLAAERTWYLVLGLTAIARFSVLGVAGSTAALSASWPTVSLASSSVRFEADVVVDKTSEPAALRQRDLYVWTILARCHLLVTRWTWNLDGQHIFISTLGQKIFKTRKFVQLRGDPTCDFPVFLRDSKPALVTQLDNEYDSAYDIFLKLITLAVRDIRSAGADGGPAAIRSASQSLTRLLNLNVPIGVAPFTRANPPTDAMLSMLFNRYLFTLVSVIVDPTADNAGRALRQMRSYLKFEDADFRSRKICIRGLMHIGFLHQQLDLDLKGIADWIREMAVILVADLRPQPTSTPTLMTNGTVRAGDSVKPMTKAEVTMLLSLLIGSIRLIINAARLESDQQTAKAPSYPDPVLLQPAWTKEILSSRLGVTDPQIGDEIIACVTAFVNARQAYFASLHRPPVEEPNEESQESYLDEFEDLNEEELAAIMGLDSGEETPVAAAKRKVAEMDKAFANVLKDDLSPALYQLVSNLMAHGVPDKMETSEKERTAYVNRLIDCWAGAANVLVQQQKRDWSSYVELGAESWQRFGDRAAKRQVGLRFMYNVAALDSTAYEPVKETILIVWFQAIVVPSPRITIEPAFCSLVLDLDKREDTFFDVKLERGVELGRDLFVERRLEILSEVLANINLVIRKDARNDLALQQRKVSLMSCVREMLNTMKDHVSTMLGPERTQYLSFCSEVVEEINGRAGQTFDPKSFPEMTFLAGLS